MRLMKAPFQGWMAALTPSARLPMKPTKSLLMERGAEGGVRSGSRKAPCLRVRGLTQSRDVADGEQASDARVAGAIIAVAFERRHVVGTEDALEADLFV